jgi:RNA polymerase sporulation-specific sigma factor
MLKYINTKLSSRDRDIINMRYGLNGENERTQQEIADMLNISRSYVSRIETKVSKKLNKFIIEEK